MRTDRLDPPEAAPHADASPRRRMLNVLQRRTGPRLPFFPKIYDPWLEYHSSEISEETLPGLLEEFHAGYMVALSLIHI